MLKLQNFIETGFEKLKKCAFETTFETHVYE